MKIALVSDAWLPQINGRSFRVVCAKPLFQRHCCIPQLAKLPGNSPGTATETRYKARHPLIWAR